MMYRHSKIEALGFWLILLGIIGIMLMSLNSCNNIATDHTIKAVIVDSGEVYYRKSNYLTAVGAITHLQYRNHEYIRFGDGNTQSIVHDPDCMIKDIRKDSVLNPKLR